MRYNFAVDSILSEYRTSNKLLQKQIADELGITREYYSRLETGKSKPSRTLFEKICRLTKAKFSLKAKNISESVPDICSFCGTLSSTKRTAIFNMIKELSTT